MAEENDDDLSFPQEEINGILQTVVETTLETAEWDEKKVPGWINDICDKTMKQLIEMKYPYKFVVTCMLIQKTDKPLMSSFSVSWENNMDGIEQLVYPPIRQKDGFMRTMQCFAAVMAVKF